MLFITGCSIVLDVTVKERADGVGMSQGASVDRVHALLVHICVLLLGGIMLLAFRLRLGALFQVLSNFVHPFELPGPLVVVQELAMVKPVVIRGVVFGMVSWSDGCGLVTVHGVISAGNIDKSVPMATSEQIEYKTIRNILNKCENITKRNNDVVGKTGAGY